MTHLLKRSISFKGPWIVNEARVRANDRAAMVKEEVTEDDIAEEIAAWPEIRIGRLPQADSERLLNLEEDFRVPLLGRGARGKAFRR